MLVPEPIHRYADTQAGIADGAIFVFADGTNPEVALIVELQSDKGPPPQWRFAAARIGAAEMWVTLDGREVWRRGGSGGGRQEEYAIFGVPYAPAPKGVGTANPKPATGAGEGK